MPTAETYDAVIIGAGLGGLTTGAMLAKLERMKVLILEKEDVIGGRIYTFEHYDGGEKTFLRRLWNNSRSRIVAARPSVSELIENKTFSKYVFETGWHGFIASDRSRLAFIASALGEKLKIYGNDGYRLFGDGKWQGLRFLMRGWGPEDFEEGKRVAREMNLMSKEEADAYDHIDLQSFMRSRTRNENVIDFHLWLASWELGTNDPTRMSAGEHIKVITTVNCSGKDFEHGGCGQPAGGHSAMARVFQKVIEESGGRIQLNTAVEEIMVEDYCAVGVRTRDGELRVPKIICNVPMQRAFDLLGDEYWPEDLKKRADGFETCGGILGWISLKEPLDAGYKGIYVVPVLPGCAESDGFTGNVLFTFEDMATYDKTRAPEGEGLIPIYAAMNTKDPDEIHNQELIDKIVNGIFTFFRDEYPGFMEKVNWYYVTVCEELWSVATKPGMVGNRRMPVKSPIVSNLFFTGDSTEQWSIGESGAAGSAVNCASAVTGKDLSVHLPFYMR